MRDFANEPVAELRRAPERERLLEALATLDERLPIRAANVIGGERRSGDELVSTDPGEPGRVVALAPVATPAEIDQALDVVQAGAAAWAATSWEARAAVLTRAAAWMRERRPELAAACVRECAKPWAEADADVCEAIDFLEFYAREALALGEGRPLLQAPGERNTLRYGPRGVTAVIAPWNFPLAILTGMTAAALVTGNTVVMKPAEQAPGCGSLVADALYAAGVPATALAVLHGGGDVGAALVADRRVAAIAFTGSAAVGLQIARVAAEVADGQKHIKHTVLELGGKNCVIVDADADLDDAVPAIVTSAFAYAGQKCSAASRLLVHERIHDALVQRLAGAVQVLQVGQAAVFGTEVPPVIEQAARDRIRGYAEQAAKAGRLLATHEVPAAGWFAAPAVVTDLDGAAPVLREEVFGPLLTVERVRGIDEACDRVDALPVGLTGGLFSRSPKVVREVAARTPVGNLYVNRAITGAMVGRQPFGGHRLSGTGSKAGGHDYLLGFVQARVITENTMRHGLAM